MLHAIAYPVSAEIVARAEEQVRFHKREWDSYGSSPITDDDLKVAKFRLEDATKELRELTSKRFRQNRCRRAILRAVAWVCEWPLFRDQPWWLPSLFTGLPGFVVGASVPAALRCSFVQALIAGLLGYTLFLLGTILVLNCYRESSIRAEIDLITFQYADHLNDIRFADRKRFEALQRFESLRKGRLLEDQYKLAVAKCEQLTKLLHDKRHNLLYTDWRSLRGIAFENFLADVFRVLGFHVEMTKASGDQGVDLIVTKGQGRRIAVQAKGYGKSVGNKAVQEALAGMRFYQCPECAVITNSKFTSGALALAVKLPECTVIDGACLSDLIRGNIY
jgi:hypothetical protein